MKGGVSDADGGESAEKDRVGDGVKCCTKVKEDVDGERTERERERERQFKSIFKLLYKKTIKWCIQLPFSLKLS